MDLQRFLNEWNEVISVLSLILTVIPLIANSRLGRWIGNRVAETFQIFRRRSILRLGKELDRLEEHKVSPSRLNTHMLEKLMLAAQRLAMMIIFLGTGIYLTVLDPSLVAAATPNPSNEREMAAVAAIFMIAGFFSYFSVISLTADALVSYGYVRDYDETKNRLVNRITYLKKQAGIDAEPAPPAGNQLAAEAQTPPVDTPAPTQPEPAAAEPQAPAGKPEGQESGATLHDATKHG